jgi:hypothetical protein
MRLSRARTQLKEEMVSMMGTAFEGQRLQAGFTFRIVEAVKRIKIHPISQMKGLPWGISLATGLLITILCINPTLISFNHIGTPIYSPLPVESKVLKVGEIPVDVVKTSNIAVLSNEMGKGNGGEPNLPNMQNAFFMAPQGEGGEWAKKADMPTARIDMSSAAVNGKIYVIGGATWNNNVGCLSIVEEYNPETDTWKNVADMPTGRQLLTASEVNGKIYVIGGAIGKFRDVNWNDPEWKGLSTIEEYTPDNWQPEQSVVSPQGKLPNRWGNIKSR